MSRTRSDWERVVSDFRRSGMKQRDFCRSRGVAVSTLQYWMRKLRGGKKLQIVPVRVVSGSSGDRAELEARVGSVALRFSSEVPAAYAIALLRGLAESC